MTWQERIRIRIAQITRRWGTDILAVRWLPVSGGSAGQTKTVSDTMTLSDQVRRGQGNLVSDTLTLADALSSALGFPKTFSDTITLADAVSRQLLVPLVETVSDTITLTDGAPTRTDDYLLTIICPHLGQNWLDAASEALGGGGALTQTVSDDLNNWSDFLLVGYGALNSDQVVLSDSLGSGYGALLSDSEAANWTDALSSSTGSSVLTITATDNLNNWLDFLQAGFGAATSDQIVLTDSTSMGYGFLLSDSEAANWLDSLTSVLGLNKTLSDNLSNWLDVLLKVLGMNAALTDTESANWLDALTNVLGMNETASDDLPMLDSSSLGYGDIFSDLITLSDGPVIETNQWQITIICPHLGQNWLDAVSTALLAGGLSLTVSDNLNNWADALLVGYGAQNSDQLVLVDSVSSGYGFLLSDSEAANWLDALAKVLGLSETLSDSENANWLDFLQAGFGALTSDQIVLTDSLSSGYAFLLSDSESANWLDALAKVLGMNETLTDTESANWLDFLAAGYGSATSDQIVIVDSLSSGYGALVSDNLNNWLDSVTLSTSLVLLLSDSLNNWLDFLLIGFGALNSDQLVLTDSTSMGYGFLLSDNLNNWLDFVSVVMGLLRTLSDSESANWLDFVQAGFGAATSDQLVIVDSLSSGYGNLLSDSMNNWLDSVVISGPASLLLSDSLNNWLDFLQVGFGALNSDQLVLTDSTSMGYGFLLSDVLGNWADLVTVVMGLLETLTDTESANWLDFLRIGYGTSFSDQLVIVDSASMGYGFLLSDNLNNWLDAAVLALGSSLAFSDALTLTDSLSSGYGLLISQSLNNWLDSVVIAEELDAAVSDNLNNWFDFLLVGYGNLTSDQIVLTDSTSAGYGFLLSDNLNNWLDAVVLQINQPLIQLTVSDNLNNWLDFLQAGYGNLTSDQVVIVDSLSMGYGALLSDSMNNWLDSVTLVQGLLETLSDSESANWLDALRIGYGDLVSDALTLADQLLAGYGNATSDQLVILDSLSSGFGFLLSDNLNNWLDFLQAGYGSATSDQIVIVDSLSAGYGFILSDVLGNWADALLIGFGILILLSDNLNNWLDSVQLLTGLVETLADSESANWLDSLLAGFGMATSDQLVILDSAFIGYGFLLSDNLNNWLDAVIVSLLGSGALTLVVSDNLNNWLDALRAGFGASTSDQIVIVDSLSSGYGSLLSDSEAANWLDVLLKQLIGVLTKTITDTESANWLDALSKVLGLTEVLSDTENANWLDALRAGYGAATSDQIVILDDVDQGYGFLLSDTETANWLDALTKTLDLNKSLSDSESANWLDALQAGFGAAMSDQLVLLDTVSLTSGYGLLLSDDLNSWLDALAMSLGLNEVLSDNLNSWLDALGVGYGNVLADAFAGMLDRLTAGYGMATSDQLVLVDSTSTGYGLLVNDNLNNWLDLLQLQILSPGAFTLIVSDNLNNWLDSLRIGYGLLDSDQLVLQDFLGAGFGSLTSDQLVLVDSVSMGYGALFSDSLFSWLDAISLLEVGLLEVTDELAVFDELGTGYGMLTSDSSLPQDQLRIGYGFVIVDDDIVWQDLAFVGTTTEEQLHLSDDLDNWLDALIFSQSRNRGPAKYFRLEILSRAQFDRIMVSSRAKFMQLDVEPVGQYSQLRVDQKARYDDLRVESTVRFYLNQSLVSSLGGPIEKGKMFVALSDTLNSWLAAVSSINTNPASLVLGLSDMSSASDSLGMEYGMSVSEDFNNWLDFFAPGTMTLTLADIQLGWIEALRLGYGSAIASQLTLTDNLRSGYSMTVSDNASSWLDFVASSEVVSLALTDSYSWTEALRTGYGNAVADDLNSWDEFIPGFVNDFGADIGESMNFWQDSLTAAVN